VEAALYHRQYGFYSTGGSAGRRGDFITSPEIGPLFGHVVANALDTEWERLGQPGVFTVVDFGAGPGTLARSVAAAAPRCASSMRYIAVERSAGQRAHHPSGVISVEFLSPELIGEGIVGVVIANELLDNLPFTPVVRVNGDLRFLEVSVDDDNALKALASLSSPEDDPFDVELEAAVLQTDAASWLRDMLGAVVAGRVLMIDYARTSSALVEVRTYASHGRAGDPLVDLGTKDITVDVDLEQLERSVVRATRITSQASWLELHGLSRLVAEGRVLWAEGASTGSLEAMWGRSRVREAEALTEAEGLGGFSVAEWTAGEFDYL
jgi:NADH dehydrogenase [ubiquinone] 1 alpha subcomplex assembly factor 7